MLTHTCHTFTNSPKHSSHLISQIDGDEKKVYFMNEMKSIVNILRDFVIHDGWNLSRLIFGDLMNQFWGYLY